MSDEWPDGEGRNQPPSAEDEFTGAPTQQLHSDPHTLGAAGDSLIKPSTVPPGTQVGHYKVLRLIGRGGMGEVYLARDTRLGRKVALKVLRPGAIGSRDAAERFIFEARATARFNFPHIVTIFDVSEFEGRPYVALEYLEGQSLRQRLQEERLGITESIRIALAVAEALQEAHKHLILHRDLKPGNVMIPRDGRIRVLDFGLAKAVAEEAPAGEEAVTVERPAVSEDDATLEVFQTRVGGVRGTPAYMAPEQWEEQPCTTATDIWALGLLLWEMIAGRHPYPGLSAYQLFLQICRDQPMPSLDVDAPPALARLVDGCLAKAPADRPVITEVIETLQDLLAGSAKPRDLERSPFRGLLPFNEQHAEQFFGRETEIATFLERLREEPLLPVVGPSGAGKSSFVQAGIIPRLLEQGRWTVIKMRPGSAPFRTLAARLLWGWGGGSRGRPSESLVASAASTAGPEGDGRAASLAPDLDEAEQQLARELAASPASLALRLGQIADRESSRLLFFIDQLEELYTLVEDKAQRDAFLGAICQAADDPQGPVRAIFTLRDDFLGRMALGASRQALSQVSVLGSPAPSGIAEILTRPVRAAGYGYDDPGLVPAMIEAVKDEPAALPLLQFTGRVLWERRDTKKRLLLEAVYDEIGGVEGALAHHAEALLEALPAERVRVARQIFMRMVTADKKRTIVARSVLLAELEPDARSVLDHLVSGRLLLAHKASTASPSVDSG